MCFSATASFSASVVLTAIGIVSIKQVTHKSQIVFACIPLFFAAQQFIEGLVWVSFAVPFNATLNLYATYGFIIFSQLVWPIWVPLAMVMVENKGRRYKIQMLFVAIGLTEALYQVYAVLTYPVQSVITGHHIYYELKEPVSILKYIEPAFYIIAIIISPFFTSIKKMWILGVAIFLSCLITVIFYQHYTVSVWCFFASAISISVYFIMRGIKKKHNLIPLA